MSKEKHRMGAGLDGVPDPAGVKKNASWSGFDADILWRKAMADKKLRLLYLLKILWEKTDEEHAVSILEIMEELSKYGVSTERKTIYRDMEHLREFGIDIITRQRGKNYYHLGHRGFELAELKLLVDSVQSAKFITEKKSKELIRKLEKLSSIWEAKTLQRQVIVAGRVKTDNERIYYNVDQIHTAISKDVQIEFQYFRWNLKKEKELRHGGKVYQISPWALCWAEENYYMIGFDAEYEELRHYRVDKMLDIRLTRSRRK
ncbi:MAG: WYL domain-containing protein, partial [Lachnospiraceae bacterium]|nr:WYL domain-containing protein [Lachnospiraceae bacterium]